MVARRVYEDLRRARRGDDPAAEAVCRGGARTRRPVLCADGHLGYSMPIGGVVGYRDHVSPSGVGYDIACGNLAMPHQPSARRTWRRRDYVRIANAIHARVSFGMGRRNNDPMSRSPGLRRHRAVAGDWTTSACCVWRASSSARSAAAITTSTCSRTRVGQLWVGMHFGSRGFWPQDGHRISEHRRRAGHSSRTRAQGADDARAARRSCRSHNAGRTGLHRRDERRRRLRLRGSRGGRSTRSSTYSGAETTDRVHNHHNFAWREQHGGDTYWVDPQGRDAGVSRTARFHRRQHGRHRGHRLTASSRHAVRRGAVLDGPRRGTRHEPASGEESGRTSDPFRIGCAAQGTVLRGAGADEAPESYRQLEDVLAQHAGTIAVAARPPPADRRHGGSERAGSVSRD